ncbi:COR domain-containing protein [Micromonospora lupini]|uniref:COR domain-containing protein n=1 Tax=Micromonospora lupini TaxID=285679 RepID=UPI0033C4D2FB
MSDGVIVEAKHRIAAPTHGHVDLGGLGLTGGDLAELLRDVPALADVTSLDLSHNRLGSLPDAVAAWTSLTELRLDDNQLSALPDAVASWTALTRLDMNRNQLSALPDAVASWTALTRLDINRNQLSALPDAVASWTALTQLDLDHNNVSALSDAVASWTALTRLDMDGNQLDALPDAVAAWARLGVLYLDDNRITALPDAVAAWTSLHELSLSDNQLTTLPDAVAAWTSLNNLYLDGNQLTALPDAVAAWSSLYELNLEGNRLTALPDAVAAWISLAELYLDDNQLTTLPDAVAAWTSLANLYLDGNQLTALPDAIGRLGTLRTLVVDDNPLPPEVLAAAVEGTEALLAFLEDVATDGISISEAKLLFVGAGEAGKSSLLGALRGEPWRDRHQTQGMEIKPLLVTHAGREITLNGWDFGGQQAYQPAHQLFFSAPAVYVVVWKPRPGVAAGMVESWIAMIAHRAPDARVLVVASHGGPTSRADAIDEQHLKQRFGDLIVGFHEVDSAIPDDRLEVLREAIAVAAGTLPHVHRNYPASWQRTIEAVTADGQQVIDYRSYEAVAAAQGLNDFQAQTLASNAHHLGKWIYYADDDALAAFVILQPDWLNVAIAAVLDSRDAVDALGLVPHRMLGSLWGAAQAPDGTVYTREQQRLFLALMGRFELTYQVSLDAAPEPVSLIAQLVPAAQPDLRRAWAEFRPGDREYLEVCRISEGPAGGIVIPDSLMYRLIVRLHHQRYTEPDSLQGVHWQQGMVLQSRYGARALLTVRTGVGVQVQVRGPDAVTYLRQVTDEIRYCIERFWPGLTTVALVACRDGCGLPTPGAGLFDVDKLIKLRDAHGQTVAQCPISGCDAFPAIDSLLGGSRASDDALAVLQDGVALVDSHVRGLSQRVTELSDTVKANLAGVNAQLTALMWQLNDEAADGPRLFTLTPVGTSLRNPQWTTKRMRLTLYCEHSLQPVHVLEPDRRDAGVYSIDVSREWWVRAVPLLKATTMLLKPLLGVGVAELKLEFNEEQWKAVEEQVSMANETLNAAAEAANHLSAGDHSAGLAERARGGPTSPIIAEGAALRTLHVALRAQDVTIADLRKVVRPDGRILWVHRQFEHLYHGGLPVIP